MGTFEETLRNIARAKSKWQRKGEEMEEEVLQNWEDIKKGKRPMTIDVVKEPPPSYLANVIWHGKATTLELERTDKVITPKYDWATQEKDFHIEIIEYYA